MLAGDADAVDPHVNEQPGLGVALALGIAATALADADGLATGVFAPRSWVPTMRAKPNAATIRPSPNTYRRRIRSILRPVVLAKQAMHPAAGTPYREGSLGR